MCNIGCAQGDTLSAMAEFVSLGELENEKSRKPK